MKLEILLTQNLEISEKIGKEFIQYGKLLQFFCNLIPPTLGQKSVKSLRVTQIPKQNNV